MSLERSSDTYGVVLELINSTPELVAVVAVTTLIAIACSRGGQKPIREVSWAGLVITILLFLIGRCMVSVIVITGTYSGYPDTVSMISTWGIAFVILSTLSNLSIALVAFLDFCIR